MSRLKATRVPQVTPEMEALVQSRPMSWSDLAEACVYVRMQPRLAVAARWSARRRQGIAVG